MKTDISGSTSRFRDLLAADLQTLLGEHRDFLSRHAAKHDGHIIKAAGDGHWLEFPSATGAAPAPTVKTVGSVVSFISPGSPRTEGRVLVIIGRRELIAARFLSDLSSPPRRDEPWHSMAFCVPDT